MQKFVSESWLVVTLSIVFALLLAGAQTSLQPQIRANQTAELNTAVAEVVPTVATTETFEVKVEDVTYQCFKCLDQGGALTGWVVEATGPGFIDKITLVVGLTPAGDVLTGIKVIQHIETPGLGNKIESKEGNDFPVQFAGKATDTSLEVVKGTARADNEIEAITGATWSSRYVTDIVNTVMTDVAAELKQHE